MQKSGSIPQPTEYLDPLTDIDCCYYYAVPKYFGHGHPNTRWLVCMIVQNRAERVLRKMELTPRLFRSAYYQLVDDPRVYRGQRSNEKSVFHRQAVLYFTTVAAAVYLGHESFVEAMLQFRDINDEPMHSVESVQYATHMQDTRNGDLHAFPLGTVMMRCCKFACALPMLRQGWDPLRPVAMPLRRRHERRALYIIDWLDYALWLLSDRPTYPLAALVLGMASDPTLWRHTRMPIAQLLPPGNAQELGQQRRQQAGSGGLVDVDDLPPGGPRLLGVLTLAELVREYHRYQQAKLLRIDGQRQLRRAEALGINRESLLAQCQDYSAAFLQQPAASESQSPPTPPSPEPVGRNNSAKRSMPTGHQQPTNAYASEPVRILHYALERDRHGKSVRQCLAAVDVYLRRNFYLTARPMPNASARLRDARNTVVLMLNLMQKQLDELKCIALVSNGPANATRGSAAKNIGQSRRLACLRNFTKLIQLLTHVLLHSKLFATFALTDSFPPYPPPDVDFAYAEDLADAYADIRLGVAREFNADEQSCRHLTLDMLRQLHGAALAGGTVAGALRLRLKLGRPPTRQELAEAEADAESPERAGCCRKSPGNQQARQQKKPANESGNYSNSLICGLEAARWRGSPPRVSFVRVHRLLRGRRGNNPPAASRTTAAGVDISGLSPSAAQTPTAFDQLSEEADESEALTQAEAGIPLPPDLPLAESETDMNASGAAETAEAEALTTPQTLRCQARAGIARWLTDLGRHVWRRVRANGASNKRYKS